jgi:hypothetical protein
VVYGLYRDKKVGVNAGFFVRRFTGSNIIGQIIFEQLHQSEIEHLF